jgi:hypothetical protein
LIGYFDMISGLTVTYKLYPVPKAPQVPDATDISIIGTKMANFRIYSI